MRTGVEAQSRVMFFFTLHGRPSQPADSPRDHGTHDVRCLASAADRSERAERSERLVSLDALRGFDMFWILGAHQLAAAIRPLSESGPLRFFC